MVATMFSKVSFSALICIDEFTSIQHAISFYNLQRLSSRVMWGRSYSRKRRARDVRRATERAAGSQPSALGHAGQAVSING